MSRLARVLAFLRAEQRTIRQGLVAMLLASVAALAAGVTLGFITDTLEELPGLLVMVPAAIAARGNVFGALASRLGTQIHAGLYTPSREREGLVYQNIYAAAVLTLSISLLMAILAKTLASAFGLATISLLDLMVIAILAGSLSSVFVLLLTMGLAGLAQRRGWDLDSVAAPLITAAGDALTIPAIFVASFAIGLGWVTPTVAVILILVTVLLTTRGLLTDLPGTRRILRESLPILTVAAAVDILAGLVLESSLDRFVAFPVLLVLLPTILGDSGGLGGILAARLSSKLHLGVITPRGLPEGPALLDFALVFLFSVLVFPAAGAAAHLISGPLGIASPGIGTIAGVSLLAGVIATTAATVVAYYTATITTRLGLDPDTFGIPMITASMDFVGVVALIVAIIAFGVT